MSDVVVIGAGLGGLLCGRILSRNGLSVVLLEADGGPGGLLRGFEWDGIPCERGFHSVGGLAPGEALEKLFRPLGLITLPWYRADADEGDPFLRLNADTPFERSHVLEPFSQSVWRLRGGGKTLVDALAEGLDIRYRKQVVGIDNQVVTCADGSTYQASCIISSFSPLATVQLLQNHIRPSYQRRLRKMETGPDIFSVHCLLEPDCLPWQSGSVFLDGRLMIHFAEPETHILELLCFGEGNPEEMIARARERFPGLAVRKFHTLLSPGYGPVKHAHADCIAPVTPLPWLYLTGQHIGLHGILGTTVSAINTCKSISL